MKENEVDSEFSCLRLYNWKHLKNTKFVHNALLKMYLTAYSLINSSRKHLHKCILFFVFVIAQNIDDNVDPNSLSLVLF